MSSDPVFEIVQLPDGDYALQAVGDDQDPLVRIHFGREARAFLGDNDHLIAKAMISAAVKTVESLRDDAKGRRRKERNARTLH